MRHDFHVTCLPQLQVKTFVFKEGRKGSTSNICVFYQRWFPQKPLRRLYISLTHSCVAWRPGAKEAEKGYLTLPACILEVGREYGD